jgi:hypothetical protein
MSTLRVVCTGCDEIIVLTFRGIWVRKGREKATPACRKTGAYHIPPKLTAEEVSAIGNVGDEAFVKVLYPDAHFIRSEITRNYSVVSDIAVNRDQCYLSGGSWLDGCDGRTDSQR